MNASVSVLSRDLADGRLNAVSARRILFSGKLAHRFCALAAGLFGLILLTGRIYAAQPTYTVLQNFYHSTEGENPRSGLLLASDGALYGSIYSGGPFGDGTLFKIQADGSGFTVLRFFDGSNDGRNLSGRLLEGSDGRLYGTATHGGAYGHGTVFAINSDGTGFTVLRHFQYSTDGAGSSGGLTEGSDGRLYGTASAGGAFGNYGTVFAMNPDGTGFTVLRHLQSSSDGNQPLARLTEGSDGRLYGNTCYGGANGAGTLFAINPDGTGFTVLRHLESSSDGSTPHAGLIEGNDGRLYGTTFSGGMNGIGTVFGLNLDGTGFTILRHFEFFGDGQNPNAELAQESTGQLFGTTQDGGALGGGTVFVISMDGTSYTQIRQLSPAIDGESPMGQLTQDSNGRLYGTTSSGGAYSAGTLIAIDPDGTDFAVLRHIGSWSDGRTPDSELLLGADERLFGTTPVGGDYSYGTLFALNLDGTGFTVLHHLQFASDGSGIVSGLIQGADGRLYGTATYGGASGSGTVFTINPDGTGFTVLRHLQYSSDGGTIPAGLIQGSDGRLYGTTYAGGTYNSGTIFVLNIDGTGFLVLRHLQPSSDGGNQYARVVEGRDVRLYGTTNSGGVYGGGTIFSIRTDGTSFTVLRHLQLSTDGARPTAGLIQGSNGRLYGTTQSGGTYDRGTIFAINADGAGFTVMRHLEWFADGAWPWSEVIEGRDGRIYGTTSAGGSLGGGTLFRVNPDGSAFVVLRHIDWSNGEGIKPYARLSQASDGTFYGTSQEGGTYNQGTVFAFSPGDALVHFEAQAYIEAVGLTGPAAATVDRIVRELKGTYFGPDRINQTGTNYWSMLTDAWLFDRGLNVDSAGAGGIRSLKLAHNITANGAILDTTNGLMCDGVSDRPIASLSTTYTTGFTYLADTNAGNPTTSQGGFHAVGVANAGDGAGTGANSWALKGTTAPALQILGFTNGSESLSVNPLNGSGTGFRRFFVSASPTSAQWGLGTAGATDTSARFGPADNNFAPTEARWGWCRLYTAGTKLAQMPVNVRYTAILNRTTTAAERDELVAILALPIVSTAVPEITSPGTASGTYGAAFNYTIAATNTSFAFGAAGLPANLSLDPTTGEITGTPNAAGTFSATISVTNVNGTSNAPLTITIAKATASVLLDGLNHTFDGTPKNVTATTTPPDLSVTITYDGGTLAPSALGSYIVYAEIDDANYQGSTEGTLLIREVSAFDRDAIAYIDAVGLTGPAAATVDRIIRELKGTYVGADRTNQTGTDYWSRLTDAWLFDRGLNHDTGGTGGIRGLKLAHNITANGATLEVTNGLMCDGVLDRPIASLSTTYTTGFAYLAETNAGNPTTTQGGFHAVGVANAGDGWGTGANSWALKGTTAPTLQIYGFNSGSESLSVNPLNGSGSGFRRFFVNASPTSVQWGLGTAGATDTSTRFGPADNNFAPTEARWGWCRLYTAGTTLAQMAVNVRYTAIFNRTTTAAERNELAAILAHPVVSP